MDCVVNTVAAAMEKFNADRKMTKSRRPRVLADVGAIDFHRQTNPPCSLGRPTTAGITGTSEPIKRRT